MLERTLKLRKGVNRLIQLADDSDEVPNLQGGKSYGAFKLLAEEWKNLELMCDMLQVCAHVQSSLKCSINLLYRNLPTLNNHFWQLMNLPYGVQSQSSNISNKCGKAWLILRSLSTFNRD